MAEPEIIPESLIDTQSTYDPTVESQSSQVTESQNFHLVDTEESMPQVETEKKKDENVAVSSQTKYQDISNSTPVVPVEEIKIPEVEATKDDEMDFIPSSQQEIIASPLKKHLSVVSSGGSSQKRKASSSDEPPTKFARTLSEDDALTVVRKKLDEIDDIFAEDSMEQLDEVVKSPVIIQETQESNEIITESLQQMEKDLEEALSQEDAVEVKGDEEKSTKSTPATEESSTVEAQEEKSSTVDAKEETSPTVAAEKENSQDPPIISKESSPIAENSKDPEETQTVPLKTIEIVEPEVADPEVTKSTIPESEAEKSPTDTKNKPTDDLVQDCPPRISDESGICSQNALTTSTDSVPISARSRMSIEVIYDRSIDPPVKKRPRELVEIDEDGEKIVLDSSQESCDKSMEKSLVSTKVDSTTTTGSKTSDSSNEKSGYSLTNGSDETKRSSSDNTMSVDSDLLRDSPSTIDNKFAIHTADSPKRAKIDVPIKPNEKPEIVSISDSEGDTSFADENAKNKIRAANAETAKIIQVEKEINILVKLKCQLQIDEITKDCVGKVLTGVNCESPMLDFSSSRRRHSDTSACLADISGNDAKDASPSSVTSNTRPFPLSSTRLSIASAVSCSSGSSAGSLIFKNSVFQLPRGPAKHAKKMAPDVSSLENSDEAVESLKKEWKNINLLTTTIINFANNEISTMDLHNGSTDRAEIPDERIRSSTPEVDRKDKNILNVVTPKSTKKVRVSKRSKTSNANGVTTASPIVIQDVEKLVSTPSSSRKRKLSDVSMSSPSTSVMNDSIHELIGKEVFAKWSDNKYYPGTVKGKTKTKFRVNFYDGQNKLIIEDFIVPMPEILGVGLSVYATSSNDDYGSCGIIVDIKKKKDKVTYVVETDEGEKVEVGIGDIFLTNDQVQLLREDTKKDVSTPPSTPKHLGKVSLDNVVDGKRRSKRTTTPIISIKRTSTVDVAKPSVSGVVSKTKTEEVYDTTSDSSCSIYDDLTLLGYQPEIIGTPNEQETKGPASRMKGKTRSKKRKEDPEVVANLGPIPPANSKLFRGMSFILACASLDIIDRYQADNKDSDSEPGTENEEEWTRKPFVRSRLIEQINAGGGKIYENFEAVPEEEYGNTKLITNVPNLTKKSLYCLSVGIKAYNHQWIIRCCKEVSITKK